MRWLAAVVVATFLAACNCSGSISDLDAGSGGGAAGGSATGGGAVGGGATGGGAAGGGDADGGDTDGGDTDGGEADAGAPDAGAPCVDSEDPTGWTPAGLCGLVLWVSSDQGLTLDGQGHITQWSDRSPNANDLTGSCTRVIAASGAVQCTGSDLLTTASSPSLGLGDDFVMAVVGSGCCSVDATWFSVGAATLGTDHVNISSLVGTVDTDVLRTVFDPSYSVMERLRLHAGRMELCNFLTCQAVLDPTTATAGSAPQVATLGIRVNGGSPAGAENVREIVVATHVSDTGMALLVDYLRAHNGF